MKIWMHILLLCCAANIALGQQGVTIHPGGKSITINDFREDSVEGLTDWYINRNIITSLKESKAEWGIRIFFINPGRQSGRIYTLSGLDDSTDFNWIEYATEDVRDSSFRKDEKVYEKNGAAIFRSARKVYRSFPIDSLIQKLLENKLTTVPDSQTILDALKVNIGKSQSQNKSRYHSSGICFVEVKMNDLYRNFKIGRTYSSSPDSQYANEIYRILRNFFETK
jgi:hypothetical protein